MPPVQKIKDRDELDKRLPYMPWYVDKFINYKLPDLSPSSLLEYIRDYEAFFMYLMAEGIAQTSSMKEIPIELLEKLHIEEIDGFRRYLMARKEKTNSKTTISRKLSSLRSLFYYLSQLAEDDNLYPLLKRNVMAKVQIHRVKKTKEAAEQLTGKLLEDEEIHDFIQYILHGYQLDIAANPRALVSYHANKLRDACIAGLILNSGIRVSECINLDVDDIDLKKKILYVYRKGAAEDATKTPVYFREAALPYLEPYLTIRESQYKAPKKEKGLFLVVPNGQKFGSRMTKRAIQDMIIKYAQRFGKPYLTVHKLRHSFGTDYYLANDLYKTQDQLGHASPETTQLYAHLTDKTMAKAIDNTRD